METEEKKFYDGEVPQNYEQKCPVVFVLDTSGSMRGSPIDEENKGMKAFEEEIKKDPVAASRLDVAVISFDSVIKVERDFGLINESPMPSLTASGTTRLVDGCRKGIELVEERKKWYKSTGQVYFRPYIVLVTDGGPDPGQDVEGLAKEIKSLAEGKHINFWPIAVNGANLKMLNKIAVPGVGASIPPLQLDGLKFTELFKWLSSSFTKISNSKEGDKVDLTPKKDDNPFQLTV